MTSLGASTIIGCPEYALASFPSILRTSAQRRLLSLAPQLSSSGIQNEERRWAVPLLRTTRSAGFKCAVCVCRLWCDSRRCLCRRGRGARRGVSSTGFRTLTGYRGAAWNTGIPTTLHVDSTRLAFLCTPSHRISIYITIYKFWWRHRGVVCMCVPPSELGLYHRLESAHLSPIYKSCTSFKLSRWELALRSLALPSHIGVL